MECPRQETISPHRPTILGRPGAVAFENDQTVNSRERPRLLIIGGKRLAPKDNLGSN